MHIEFVSAAFAEVREAIQQHLRALPSAIDSYLEDHIDASRHYEIRVSDEKAGCVSVHNKSLITLFCLKPAYGHWGQEIFRQVKQLEEVQAAYVPTYDEFYLSHALDDYRRIATHAYLFVARPPIPDEASNTFALRPAVLGDIAAVQEASGDFFAHIEKYIGKQELFLTLTGETCVGFGVIDRSEFVEGVASIGMFVIERFRRQGVGTATLRLLMAECRREGRRPIAGCWYYNHPSKKTLERAGMYAPTRLLKIEY